MISFLTEGFILGLSTGTACLVTCGPIYAPFLLQKKNSIVQSILVLVQISGGRFFSYAIIGLLAGLFGSKLPIDQREWFTAIAYVLFSLYLIVSSIVSFNFERTCLAHRYSKLAQWPFLLGIFTGINICPSLLLAITRSISLSGPIAGLLLFSSFFVATTLFLLPLSFFGLLGNKKLIRDIGRFASIAVAAWFCASAAIIIEKQLSQSRSLKQSDVISVFENRQIVVFTPCDTKNLQFTKTLQQNVKSTVKETCQLSSLDSTKIVFVGTDSPVPAESLKTGGRLVIFVDRPIAQNWSLQESNLLISFLREYNFKVNKDSGSIFKLPLQK